MEIEVGEYVRIDKDFRTICLGIGKAVNKNKDTIYVKMSNNDLPISFNINNVTKHDKDIKKLIEEGDYVNGYYIRKIANYNNELCVFDLNTMQWIPLTEIDVFYSIVTHEQFSQIEYKVETEEK